MNKITDEEINSYLKLKWDALSKIDGIDINRVIGLFATGKVCHGFAETVDDMKLIAIYIPSFEEMCLNLMHENEYLDDNIYLLDFRYMFDLLKQQDLIIMECAFTDYYIIEKKYLEAYKKYVILNRETMFRYDYKTRIQNAVERGRAAANAYYLSFNKGNVNNLYEACRIRIAYELLLGGTSIENCINLKKDYHIHYLNQVLAGEVAPTLEELDADFDDLLERAQDIDTKFNQETEQLFKDILFALYTIGLTKTRDFYKILTNTELQAFEIIEKHLEQGEGYVSISQLVENSNISRPVFSNVLKKMKDSKVAEVINKGGKGTYIKITDFTILK